MMSKVFWRIFFFSSSKTHLDGRSLIFKLAVAVYCFVLSLFIFLVLLLSISVIVSTPKTHEEIAIDNEREAAVKRRAIETLPTVTSIEWAQKYSDNQVAANKEFLGKKFRITGTILGFTDDSGAAMIILNRNTNTGKDFDFALPVIRLQKKDTDKAALLKKGERIMAICVGYEPGARGQAQADACELIDK